nr:hypothetical protein [Bradyrhizobium sp. 2S1]MCK7667576.1 hypothetical protein [Bradyrhizobium sp. 2S1]
MDKPHDDTLRRPRALRVTENFYGRSASKNTRSARLVYVARLAASSGITVAKAHRKRFSKVLLCLGEHAADTLADPRALMAITLGEPARSDQKIDERLIDRHDNSDLVLL